MTSKKTKPKGILAKSEARMAAVKALYATDITSSSGDKPDPWAVTLGILSAYDSGYEEHVFAEKPDQKFLNKLISGVSSNLQEIDSIIERNLNEDWKKERIGHLMLALLRSAVFELANIEKIPFKVIINEYIEIGHTFFTEKEVKFINGILDKIAGQVR